jgi:alkaline phosphatase
MGYYHHFNGTSRHDPTDDLFDDVNFQHPAMIPLDEATHEGSDVGVYAIGPHSHLFTGVYEQHYIAHAMMYATCLGPENFLKAESCSFATAVKFSIVLLILHVFVITHLSVVL